MKNQRGQTLVEFALMAPFIFLFIFGMLYGALIFMDYLDFSNDARTVARTVAVMDENERADMFGDNTEGDATSFSVTYEKDFASFYNVKRVISLEPVNSTKPQNVVVEVNFKLDNSTLPNVLKWVGFPPETIRPIVYRMKLEYKNQNS